MVNQLRSHLREYYPAALTVFHGSGTLGLDSAHARAVLAAAPTSGSRGPTDAQPAARPAHGAGRLRRGSTPKSND
ncbi:hypothetical protein [Yinghuangia sp. YIM S10712]|uniref:hypothetical protein n=1 Tax=Yinghuangia sp. YIM S10712 TaxID=3436930 RepID=UPI003F53B3C6